MNKKLSVIHYFTFVIIPGEEWMGIIGKAHDWYQRHRAVRALATAAEGVALLSGSAADVAAAEIFFNKPVVAASVSQAEEKSPLDISGDARAFGRSSHFGC